MRTFGNCDDKDSAHDPTIEFIKTLAGHILNGSFLYDPAVPSKIEECKEPQGFQKLGKADTAFTDEIVHSARNYEEVAEVAEAKINSWDSFFEQK